MTQPGTGCSGQTTETDRDKILFSMLPAAKRAERGSYFYKRALTVADNRELYGILAQCGWKDFKGLISTYVKKESQCRHITVVRTASDESASHDRRGASDGASGDRPYLVRLPERKLREKKLGCQ